MPFENVFPEFTSSFSFIRSISQISREVFLLVERICWVFSLRLNIEVNLVLLIDMEETGAGDLASLWLVHTPHIALWLADDWRISPGDHSSFSLHHHLSAPLNSCQPSLKLYLYEKSKISISNNPACLSEWIGVLLKTDFEETPPIFVASNGMHLLACKMQIRRWTQLGKLFSKMLLLAFLNLLRLVD